MGDAVGVGLSVAFAVLMLIFGVELYYIWTKSRSRRLLEAQPDIEEAVVVMVATATTRAIEGGWMKRKMEELWWNRSKAGPIAAERAVSSGGDIEIATEAAAEEDEDADDIFKLVGHLGPPRLLYTITEETHDELLANLDEEGVRSVVGSTAKGSRRSSLASSELLFVSSAATSPFVTPPTSPLSATSPPLVPPKDDDSASSSSCSPPFPASPTPIRRPLSFLFEESTTSSNSSSSSAPSSSATPATLSPPPPKPLRRPLALLFDPPLAPSAAALLYNHHRVHPLLPSPPNLRHLPDKLPACNIDGLPIRHTRKHPVGTNFYLPYPTSVSSPSSSPPVFTAPSSPFHSFASSPSDRFKLAVNHSSTADPAVISDV